MGGAGRNPNAISAADPNTPEPGANPVAPPQPAVEVVEGTPVLPRAESVSLDAPVIAGPATAITTIDTALPQPADPQDIAAPVEEVTPPAPEPEELAILGSAVPRATTTRLSWS